MCSDKRNFRGGGMILGVMLRKDHGGLYKARTKMVALIYPPSLLSISFDCR